MTQADRPAMTFGWGVVFGTLGGLIGLGGAEFRAIADHWPVIVNLLAGSMLGAWFGSGRATRMDSHSLSRVIALLPTGIAAVLLFGHDADGSGIPLPGGIARAIAGMAKGSVIGVGACLLGVAGGELLVPTVKVWWHAQPVPGSDCTVSANRLVKIDL